jgi:hypothetical protein
MKNAQIQAQVFVYVLAMIVISLVLLYGYRSIDTMNERAKQIDILAFKNDVIRAVEKVSNDYGTVRTPSFNIPQDYIEVCFIDMQGHSPPIELKSEHPLVYEAWEDESANVFLIKDLVEESLLVGDESNYLISIDEPNYLCIEVKNRRVKVRLEGMGGKSRLSEIE